MATYRVTMGGSTYKIEAPDDASAKGTISKLQLQLAGQQGVDQATEGAVKRKAQAETEATIAPTNPLTDAALAGMSGEGGTYADPNATGADIASRAETLGSTAAIAGTAGGIVAAGGPVAAAGHVLRYLVPAWAGGEAGRKVGGMVGGSKGAAIGGVVGTIAGGMGGPATVGSILRGASREAIPLAEAAAPKTIGALMSEAAPAAGPMTKSIAPLTAESVLAKVAKLKEMGLSRGQIISSLKETHGLKESAAAKVVKMIEEMAQ